MNERRITLFLCLVVATCASRPPSGSPPGSTAGGGRVGEFVWQDLMTDDAAKSRVFYERLLGWKFERVDRLGRPYLIARAGSGPIAGIAQVEHRPTDEPVAQWLSYLAVADVDAVAARLPAAGARLLVAPTDIFRSRAAVAVDPQGAPFGLVELGPGVKPPAGGAAAPVGTFFWRDYLARDVDLARAFYCDLAGLAAERRERSDPLLHFVLIRPGPVPVAGVVPIGERRIAPNWLPYIRVDDPAALAARAEQLGGRILLRPRPDLRRGSVAVVTDPGGAALALQKWPF